MMPWVSLFMVRYNRNDALGKPNTESHGFFKKGKRLLSSVKL